MTGKDESFLIFFYDFHDRFRVAFSLDPWNFFLASCFLLRESCQPGYREILGLNLMFYEWPISVSHGRSDGYCGPMWSHLQEALIPLGQCGCGIIMISH